MLAVCCVVYMCPAPHSTHAPQVLGPEVASAPELRRLRQVILQQEFGMFPGDTGSTEVQGMHLLWCVCHGVMCPEMADG